MNQTYYGGQIKTEYRGHFAVFLRTQRDINNPLLFSKIPMGTQAYVDKSALNLASPFPLPFRTYLQVNDKGYEKIKSGFTDAWQQDRESFSEAALDKLIVEEGVVESYADAFENILKAADLHNLRTLKAADLHNLRTALHF